MNGHKQDAKTQTNSQLLFWFSVISFAILLGFSLASPGWSQQNNDLFKTLLALAAAGIGAHVPGFFKIEGGFFKAGGAIAFFLLVFLFKPARDQESTAFAIRINPLSPSSSYPTLKNPELKIWYKNEWLKGKYSEEGVADFKNLPPEMIGQTVAIQCSSEYYRPISDSITILPPAITLDFIPDGSLGEIRGTIQDTHGNFLSGVVVRIDNHSDTTSTSGGFLISVPVDQQKARYRLIAEKKGYNTWENMFSPIAGQEAPVVMIKSKR